MIPWYKNFKGLIEKKDTTTFNCRGLYSINKNFVIITELPIGKWTYKYQEFFFNCLFTASITTSGVIEVVHS